LFSLVGTKLYSTVIAKVEKQSARPVDVSALRVALACNRDLEAGALGIVEHGANIVFGSCPVLPALRSTDDRRLHRI
jgi:hypothetical protein